MCIYKSNFKLLFNHTAQNNLGNRVLNGEDQNIGSYPINNVMGVLHLYNSLENIVGITQGFLYLIHVLNIFVNVLAFP